MSCNKLNWLLIWVIICICMLNWAHRPFLYVGITQIIIHIQSTITICLDLTVTITGKESNKNCLITLSLGCLRWQTNSLSRGPLWKTRKSQMLFSSECARLKDIEKRRYRNSMKRHEQNKKHIPLIFCPSALVKHVNYLLGWSQQHLKWWTFEAKSIHF